MDISWKNPSLHNVEKKCSLLTNICKAFQVRLNNGSIFRLVTQEERLYKQTVKI